MPKRTPLYDLHIKYGGKIVEFAGYELPIMYETGLIREHVAVRTAAGLFDVSHMGELIASGKNAERELNRLLSNDISGMYDGQVRYSILTNERGGAVDDVLVYRHSAEKFMLVVNASNLEEDAGWVRKNLPLDVDFCDISSSVAQIALQGPLSDRILSKLAKAEHVPQRYYSFVENALLAGKKCLISQTGYTGERGYEIYCDNDDACDIFEAIMAAGRADGLLPCGLGARDTLRLEAGMPLYGHEMTEDYPINELDLGFCIKMNKDDFIGKNALIHHTPAFERRGAKIVDKGIAREHCKVYARQKPDCTCHKGATGEKETIGLEKTVCLEKEVGEVTSGTHSPTLGYPIAVLRIEKGYENHILEADVRGRRLRLELIPLPFYKR